MKRVPVRVRSFLFDLDGTLVDSSDLIISVFRTSVRDVAHMQIREDEVLQQWGLPLREMLDRLNVPNPTAVIDYYRRHYPFGQRTRLFDGTGELLSLLAHRQYRMAVVTTKNSKDAVMHLDEHGIRGLFDGVVASDDVQNLKPHREPVTTALNMLDCGPDEAVMVGDSPHQCRPG
ncbi:MAG: HAD family hydrolase, partial [Bacillota bacterium]